jgi:natural product precursor
MKKKISSKLTLGKRSVATLSEESMSILNGGTYTNGGGGGGSGSCGCQPPASACCPSVGCPIAGGGTYAAYTQPRQC